MSTSHFLDPNDPYSQYYNIGCNSLTTNTLNAKTFNVENLTTTNIISTGTITANNINASGIINANNINASGIINANGTSIGATGVNIPSNGTYTYNSNRLMQFNYSISGDNGNIIPGSISYSASPLCTFFYPGTSNYLPISFVSIIINNFNNTSITTNITNINTVTSGSTPTILSTTVTATPADSKYRIVTLNVNNLPSGGSVIAIYAASTGGNMSARIYDVNVMYG